MSPADDDELRGDMGPRAQEGHDAGRGGPQDPESRDEQDWARQSDPDLPHTGDEAVDRALEALSGIADADPADQLDTYVGVHRALQDRLADSGV